MSIENGLSFLDALELDKFERDAGTWPGMSGDVASYLHC